MDPYTTMSMHFRGNIQVKYGSESIFWAQFRGFWEGHDTKLGHFLKQLWHGTVTIIMIRWPGNCLDHYTPINMYFMGDIQVKHGSDSFFWAQFRWFQGVWRPNQVIFGAIIACKCKYCTDEGALELCGPIQCHKHVFMGYIYVKHGPESIFWN